MAERGDHFGSKANPVVHDVLDGDVWQTVHRLGNVPRTKHADLDQVLEQVSDGVSVAMETIAVHKPVSSSN